MFVINQECRSGMAELIADNSIDAIVTDPPYGLSKEPDAAEVLRHWLNGDDYNHTGSGFMGKKWDSFVPGPATWREAFRVLKPGGYALVLQTGYPAGRAHSGSVLGEWVDWAGGNAGGIQLHRLRDGPRLHEDRKRPHNGRLDLAHIIG